MTSNLIDILFFRFERAHWRHRKTVCDSVLVGADLYERVSLKITASRSQAGFGGIQKDVL